MVKVNLRFSLKRALSKKFPNYAKSMTYRGKYLDEETIADCFWIDNGAPIMHQDICNVILHPEKNYDESRATSISIGKFISFSGWFNYEIRTKYILCIAQKQII